MKKLISFAAAVFTAVLLAVCANAQATDKIVDNAGILSGSESAELTEQINQLVLAHGVDAVIYTTNSLNGMPADRYADNAFNETGCGIGDDGDGILLLISMEGSAGNRDVFFTTHGWANGGGFTDYGTDRIIDLISYDLRSGDYSGACSYWISLCDEFMTAAEKGNPYNDFHTYRTSGERLVTFVICFAASFLIALIICLIMKSMMKTAVRKADANDYVRKNSFRVLKQRDIYIYSTFTRTPRSDGGGNHPHNSDRNFGGSGGKF
jgi:uncharacterized protein